MKHTSLFFILLLLVTSLIAQSNEPEHSGVKLYLEGKYAEAENSLSAAVQQPEWKSNPAIWNYLGLAYIGMKEFKKARKPIQVAISLAPGNSIYHTNLSYLRLMTRDLNESRDEATKAIELDRNNVSAYYLRGMVLMWQDKLDSAQSDSEMMTQLAPADARGYVLKSNILMSRLGQSLTVDPKANIRDKAYFVTQARETLMAGAERVKNGVNRPMLDEELASIEAFNRYFTSEPRNPSDQPEANVTPIKILYKPRATYTDRARYANVEGKVRVAVLLGADGRVQYILFLKRLGAGLDEEVIKAAKQIKFEPKKIDGKPVSDVLTVEYGFDIY